MAEINQINFDFKEIVRALLEREGITEGLWGPHIEFQFTAGNFGTTRENVDITPGVMVGVKKIGLQRFTEPSNLTVDAAEIDSSKSKGGKSRNIK